MANWGKYDLISCITQSGKGWADILWMISTLFFSALPARQVIKPLFSCVPSSRFDRCCSQVCPPPAQWYLIAIPPLSTMKLRQHQRQILCKFWSLVFYSWFRTIPRTLNSIRTRGLALKQDKHRQAGSYSSSTRPGRASSSTSPVLLRNGHLWSCSTVRRSSIFINSNN